jgi:membrane peptidoglycan carboxypeptidase
MSLTTATIVSDNTVFAQLTQLVGPSNVAREAHLLGIQSKLPGYFAIGLGAIAVNPLEMARAYSTFANDGQRLDGRVLGNEPIAVDTIVDAHGKLVGANKPVAHQVLSQAATRTLNSILMGVVTSGTGTHAALPGRQVAGKTGTTENYGDAWFVGYTPQLVVAVWVGYPTKLVPMLREYHGKPVAGGTFPAEIWKAFAGAALTQLNDPPEYFPSAPQLYASPRTVAWRNGKLGLDNGYCRNTVQIVYFGSSGPGRTANCKPNEVDVPSVVGDSVAAARARLDLQPLTARLVFKPAKAKQKLGVVLAQFPAGGTLSSHERVLLVVAKPLHGVVPKVVGLTVAQARRRLGKSYAVRSDLASGRVVTQDPPAGVAAAPGMAVRLGVRSG